jgi:nucleoside-triphosphatase
MTRTDPISSRGKRPQKQTSVDNGIDSGPSRRTAILLTGRPGSGKTTLIRRLLADCKLEAGGFFTQEVRVGGARRGFEIVTLTGERGVLAHVDIRGRHRVGRYGVDLSSLEALGVSAIQGAVEAGGLVVIDEIGPMELLSDRFRGAVLGALDSSVPLLGTIVWRSMPFADRIKARDDVQVIEVRPDNRDAVVAQVRAWLEGHPPRSGGGRDDRRQL